MIVALTMLVTDQTGEQQEFVMQVLKQLNIKLEHFVLELESYALKVQKSIFNRTTPLDYKNEVMSLFQQITIDFLRHPDSLVEYRVPHEDARDSQLGTSGKISVVIRRYQTIVEHICVEL